MAQSEIEKSPAQEPNPGYIWHEKKDRQILNQPWQIHLTHPFTSETITTACHPSALYHSSPFSGENLKIQLLPTKSLIRHEWFLTEGLKNVSFLKEGIPSWNDAPMVGAIDEDENIVLIDGSTRLTRAEVITYIAHLLYPSLPPPVFPVQIVDFHHPDLLLDIWEEHHSPQHKLSKNEVLKMALNNQYVMAKQTKFGVHTGGGNVYSFAETQSVLNIPIKHILGFEPPNDQLWSWILA